MTVSFELISDAMVSIAALAYAASAIGFYVHMTARVGSERVIHIGRVLLAIGVAFNLAFVVCDSLTLRVCPVKTIQLGISLGAVAAAVVYLLARKALRVHALGVFIAPMALVFVVAARFIAVPEASLALGNKLLPVHVSSNILGDAFFLLASGAAAIYLFQEHQLKAKRGITILGRVPSLELLDRVAYRFLQVGFAFMTLGVVTGTFFISKLTGGTTGELLRALFGYVTWAVFSAVLILRFTLGWRGKRAAYGTLAGFALSMLVVTLYLGKAGMESR